MNERELYATKGKSESNREDSENPSDYGFAKNCQIPATFGFEHTSLISS